jgi:hypothetical protein
MECHPKYKVSRKKQSETSLSTGPNGPLRRKIPAIEQKFILYKDNTNPNVTQD